MFVIIAKTESYLLLLEGVMKIKHKRLSDRIIENRKSFMQVLHVLACSKIPMTRKALLERVSCDVLSATTFLINIKAVRYTTPQEESSCQQAFEITSLGKKLLKEFEGEIDEYF
jgi:hypothetical protein